MGVKGEEGCTAATSLLARSLFFLKQMPASGSCYLSPPRYHTYYYTLELGFENHFSLTENMETYIKDPTTLP